MGNLFSALEECIEVEQKFQKAAYYDAKKHISFERHQRQHNP